jgi:hypothetical protein
MNWLYNGIEVTDELIPEGAVGFVYMITHIPTNRFYIGKKNLGSVRNIRLGKRELERVKLERKELKKPGPTPKKKQVRKSSDWVTYYSSNKWINEQIKDGKEDEFRRDIIEFSFSSKNLSYLETYYQFKHEVLTNEFSINDNIMGRFFRKDTINNNKS